VRLRSHGTVLGAFASPPFGVMAMRAVSLAAHADVDAAVPAATLARCLSGGGLEVSLPADVPAPAWAGLLPPRAGWRPVAEVPAEPVRRAVAEGVREFREAVGALPEDRRTDRALLDRLAASTWERPVVAGVPLRAAHAAAALGFLAGERVSVLAAGPWLRLDGGNGTTFVRRAGAPSLRLA
jgi:hypothetical protein